MGTPNLNTFSESDVRSTQPAMKVGLLATVTPGGLPHVTLLSSVMACSPTQLCFGQFTEGYSKQHILTDPKVGFLIMGLDKNLWRGTAVFSHAMKNGPEYEYYNNVPMFRYNAYFGVHTVYYLDLVAQSGKQPLPMNTIILAAVKTMLARTLGSKPEAQPALNHWTRSFVDKIDNLKFLSYVNAEGYPVLIPAIQTQSLGTGHVLFSTSVFPDELLAIPPGVPLAIFCMALSMEDVLLRGTYLGVRRMGGMKAGVVEVDWVYNPMPPVAGQVYPPVALEAVKEF